ncbi:AI-2E family transporter [Agromyces intestinalis]|uniref:AI-2E family transporter n=1 Tax=Agromyces intestinalis TaxID=2592652 RepID=A0A5C1YKE4_9MICO|nr:AI-2E family transporter [Agromyces intestinalis]QEO15760.1 AI-2E family transporter [Agromyces intestinalis]
MRIDHAFRVGLIGTLGVGVGLLILYSVASLSTILTYVGAALFLALGLEPAIAWLERRGLPRWSAILVVLAVVAAVATALLLAVIPIVVDQVSQLVEQAPAVIARFSTTEWLDQLQQQFPQLRVREIYENLSNAVLDIVSNPIRVSELAGGIWQVAIAIGGGVFGVVVVTILTLYFTASLNPMKRGLFQLVPATQRARFADLTDQITDSVGHYVIGQVSLAAINGVLSFVFLSVIGAPFPAVLAFIAFMFSLVPLVGTLTGSVLIVLVCLLPGLGSPLTAFVAAIYYLLYMQVEAYVLSPRIMNRAVKVPAAVVVIAALAGGTLLGILGALIAIPVAAAALLIIKQVVIPRQNER